MRPLLLLASDGREHSMREAREKLAVDFELTDEDLKVLLPSGGQPLFPNRVAWAKIYLQGAGLLKCNTAGDTSGLQIGDAMCCKMGLNESPFTI
jgi:restriction system protein